MLLRTRRRRGLPCPAFGGRAAEKPATLLMRYLFLATALWHACASYFFLFRPQRILESLTTEVPVSPTARDVLRFLGALNLGYVAVAVAGATQATAAGACVVLALANGSQLAVDLYAHRTGRWKPRLAVITLLDGFFTLAFGVCLAIGIW